MSSPRSKSWIAATAAAAATICAALPLMAQSQDTQDTRSAQEIYRQDRADCMAGNTSQSKADCLNEARSALRDRTHGDPELNDSNDAAVARAADGMGSSSSSDAQAPATDSSTPMASSDTSTASDELPARADRN